MEPTGIEPVTSCAIRGVTSLIVTGVTTEVCVPATVREANDRGCLVLEDCVGSYFPHFHEIGLQMIISGWDLRVGHFVPSAAEGAQR